MEGLRINTGRGLKHRDRDDEFRRFAREFLPALLKGAYLLLHDIDLAEDAVQGTMLRVFRRWEHARNAPEAYSRAALVSVCRDYWRLQRRRPDEVLSGDAEIADEASCFSESLNDRAELVQALGELPHAQQEVLVLRFFFDFSVAQTAELLGMPEGTVKSSTHRGLDQLRRLLSPPTSEAKVC